VYTYLVCSYFISARANHFLLPFFRLASACATTLSEQSTLVVVAGTLQVPIDTDSSTESAYCTIYAVHANRSTNNFGNPGRGDPPPGQPPQCAHRHIETLSQSHEARENPCTRREMMTRRLSYFKKTCCVTRHDVLGTTILGKIHGVTSLYSQASRARGKGGGACAARPRVRHREIAAAGFIALSSNDDSVDVVLASFRGVGRRHGIKPPDDRKA
jgi:hypothetical protein